MTKIAWRLGRADLRWRKVYGAFIDALIRIVKCFRLPPPELDESHAAVRYRMAQMTREEWEAYERDRFNEACNKEVRNE